MRFLHIACATSSFRPLFCEGLVVAKPSARPVFWPKDAGEGAFAYRHAHVLGSKAKLNIRGLVVMMQMMKARIFFFLAVFAVMPVLVSNFAWGKTARPVPGHELRRMKGVYTAIWKGHKARVKLNADGTLRAVSENRFDEGYWKVEGDRLCVSFKVWTKGKFKCGRVYRKGAWYVGLYKNGTPRLRFRK